MPAPAPSSDLPLRYDPSFERREDGEAETDATPSVAAQWAGGSPALSAEVGQFLAKDAGLLAIALLIFGDSLIARAGRELPR